MGPISCAEVIVVLNLRWTDSCSSFPLDLGHAIDRLRLSSTTKITLLVNPPSITEGLMAVTSQAGVEADKKVM